MSDPVRTPTDKISARRKLLRGSFALPTVLAVHNGSALAASSTKLRAAMNQTDPNKMPPIFPAAVTVADGVPRVSVYLDSGTGKKYVKPSEVQAVANLGLLPFVSASQGTAGATDWVEYVTGGTWTQVQPTGAPGVTTTLAAVLFDGNGASPNFIRVVGIVQPTQSTGGTKVSALTASCWSSLKAG